MDWLARVGGILDNYADERRRPQPGEVERDFETYSQVAPQTTLADGLAAAFRSDRTPPFAQMLGDLFRRSGAAQRQSVLNQLAAAVGPVLLTRRGIQATANGRGGWEVATEAADRVPAETVSELAQEAEQADPSLIDRLSLAYAQQPQIVKTLGQAALTVALAHMARRQAVHR